MKKPIKIVKSFQQEVTIEDPNIDGYTALTETGCRICVMPSVMESMTPETRTRVIVEFIRFNQDLTDSIVANWLRDNGLQACNPFALAAANKQRMSLAREYPNYTQWGVGETYHHLLFDCIQEPRVLGFDNGRALESYQWLAAESL